jgi:hypothetical protein
LAAAHGNAHDGGDRAEVNNDLDHVSDGDDGDEIAMMMDTDPPSPDKDDDYVPAIEPDALEAVLASPTDARPKRRRRKRQHDDYYEGSDYAGTDFAQSEPEY